MILGPVGTGQPELGSVVGGDFRVVSKLDEGGMGAVYVAEQLSTGKRRALKLMHGGIVTDSGARRRFEQEARVGARISSEHVVEVVAAGVDAATGMPWLAMELLDGASLTRRVEQGGPLAPDEALAVFEQVGHALSAAHRVDVVHRDLKPDNIYLAKSQRRDVAITVKILDFGIAKIVQSASRAGNSQVIGSPLWMAPEQLTREVTISPATDIWALGLIAFYVLTGKCYWRSAHDPEASTASVVHELVNSTIDAPTARLASLGGGPRLPPAFDAWFSRAVCRDPAARFHSVDAMLEALSPILRGRSAGVVETVVAAPPAVSPPVAVKPIVSSSGTKPMVSGTMPMRSSGTMPMEMTSNVAPPSRGLPGRWLVVLGVCLVVAVGVAAAMLGGMNLAPSAPVASTTATTAMQRAGAPAVLTPPMVIAPQPAVADLSDSGARPPAAAVPRDEATGETYEQVLASGDNAATRGHTSTAVSAYQRAIAINPRGDAALSALAFINLNRGRNHEAAQLAERAVAANPRNAQGWIVLGAARDALGQRAAAREAYRNCVEHGVGRWVRECRQLL